MNFSPEEERDPAKMLAIYEKMSPAEQDRFEHYKRSRFNKAAVAARMREALPPDAPLTQDSTVVVSTLAKMYVGDLIKAARRERARRGDGDDASPLTPSEYAAAARALERSADRPAGDHKRPRLNGPPVFSPDELL